MLHPVERLSNVFDRVIVSNANNFSFADGAVWSEIKSVLVSNTRGLHTVRLEALKVVYLFVYFNSIMWKHVNVLLTLFRFQMFHKTFISRQYDLAADREFSGA